MNFNQDKINELKAFIKLCESNPQVLHMPQFGFFKDYLVSMGANIPEGKAQTPPSTACVLPVTLRVFLFLNLDLSLRYSQSTPPPKPAAPKESDDDEPPPLEEMDDDSAEPEMEVDEPEEEEKEERTYQESF